jgi:hydroxymethylpyrimidine/phosphomethylpyrimidine kinase
MNGRVLSVAGSDSGGGAGIQADIKTVTALGGYAATAITAVTDQDTRAVYGVQMMPPEFIARQIKSVVSDIGADVIKTGMLASREIVSAVAQALREYAPAVPRVIDPVMVAKGGHRLIADDATTVLLDELVRGAAVVTPNLPEAEVITGREIRSADDMFEAVDALRALDADAVVLKGGHLEGDVLIDLLITRDDVTVFEGQRISSTSTHGTGCTLASAIATGLAQKMEIADAVDRARQYVFRAIETAPGYGSGHGPLNHGHTVVDSPNSRSRQ